jgi:hypothetical protein
MQKRLILSSFFVCLLSVSSLPASAAIKIALSSQNPVAARLEGSWETEAELSERLLGERSETSRYVTFRSDAAALDSAPLEGALGGRPAYLAGVMEFPGAEFFFALTAEGGSPQVVCVKRGKVGVQALSFLLLLVPGAEKTTDLLFLGGGSLQEPFLTYQRTPAELESKLSSETLSVVRQAIESGQGIERVDRELPMRSDWQGVVDLLIEEIRRNPRGPHNNRCLLLEAIVRKHSGEVRMDVLPVIQVLASRSPTNQQKAAQILAAAAERKDLFRGHEQEAARALIPLTASQRGRVVRPALETLHRLTGQSFGRVPEAWSKWFKETYDERVDLSSAVYELLAVVRRDASGRETFTLDGKPAGGLPELTAALREFRVRAEGLGLKPSVALITQGDISQDVARGLVPAEVEKLFGILDSLGIKSLNAAPATDEFYPPWLVKPAKEPEGGASPDR